MRTHSLTQLQFLLGLSALLLASASAADCPEQKVLASDGAPEDQFGGSVALAGDLAVVGAEEVDGSRLNSWAGAAYVFRNDGAAWVEETVLIPGDRLNFDRFGRSVSVSGNVVVVGADLANNGGVNFGAVYVFRYDGTAWIEEAELIPSDASDGLTFGGSVSLSGDLLLVGAPQIGTGQDPGKAYVFRYDGSSWREEARFAPTDLFVSSRFGGSVSLSGDVALVGAYQDTTVTTIHGSAYVFRYDGIAWAEEAKLTASDGASFDAFGRGVALSGDVALIGADSHATGGMPLAGAVYVFRYDGLEWLEEAKLTLTDPATLDTFGSSVSLSDNVALVGARRNADSGVRSGSAYLFRHDGVAWVPGSQLLASDAVEDEEFGTAVSLSGSLALIGAALDDDDGVESGSAYFFDCLSELCTTDRDCDDGIECTDDSCDLDAAVCVNVPAPVGRPCDDGLPCTEDDACRADLGCEGSPVDCDDGNACTDDVCEPATGACLNLPRDCDDGNACTDDSCDAATGCVSVPSAPSSFCDDGDACTESDACDGAAGCAGSPVDCDDGIDCTVDVCDGSTGECNHTAVGCEDCLVQKVIASDGAASDSFGADVSVSDGLALIGVYADDGAGGDAGAAYILRHDGSNWMEEARLVASDAQAGAIFGFSVSVSGNLALISAPNDDEGGGSAGAAYVFRHDGSAWTQEAKLIASDSSPSDQFGWSVSLSNEAILVGARGDDDGGSRSGGAYVFRHDGTAWVQEAKLVASDAAEEDFFGASVALSGELALVGAFKDDDGGSESGSAYLFRYDASAWAQEAKLVASDAGLDEQFGFSVSVSRDVALVGANHDASGGSAYVFRRHGLAWVEEAKFVASDARSSDGFGKDVSVEFDVAVVGASGNDDAGINSGSAYLYRFDGSEWREAGKLLADDAAPADTLGGSVSVSAGAALVGASGDEVAGVRVGSAYFFECVATDSCPVPEISYSGLAADQGAFLVAKDGSDLRFSWQDSPYEVGIYVGSLDSLHGAGGYDHDASSACRLTGVELVFTELVPAAAYLLVVGSGCEDSSLDGPLGRDSMGRPRPAAEDVGGSSCP